MDQSAQNRLSRVRNRFPDLDIQAFLVSTASPFPTSPVPDHDKRVDWLTGFGGSPALAVITWNRAAVFVTARDLTQAQTELDTETFTIGTLAIDTIAAWLATGSEQDPVATTGYDPTLHSSRFIREAVSHFASHDLELIPVANPVDMAWSDQPKQVVGRLFPQTPSFAGESSLSKRQRISATLCQSGYSALIVTKPECIAWLLNIRGRYIPHNPVPLGYGMLMSDGRFRLFAECRNLPLDNTLTGMIGVTIHRFEDAVHAIRRLEGKVLFDGSTTPSIIHDWLDESDAVPVDGQDPCMDNMAIKNVTELDGFRHAHHRDGLGMVQLLYWLDNQDLADLTELALTRKVEQLRRSLGNFQEMSFPTIVATGRNAAIIHYHATPHSNRRLVPGEVVIIDSGCQYMDGTTDVTRTVAVGYPSGTYARLYTTVLKSLVMLSTARWPADEPAGKLDAMARYNLWKSGHDYPHGTGHGVGHYLNVHEGNGTISPRSSDPLRPGMVVTIEPGLYQVNEFGIRLENMATVKTATGNADMLEFETLTMVPFDRRLIAVEMLDRAELEWINCYHARIRDHLASELSVATRNWLCAVCSLLER